MDISLLGAVVAGLLSFLSPCILPIVPFYLWEIDKKYTSNSL